MKKLLSIVVLALIGMVGVGRAAGVGWITTTSSAVFVSSATDLEVTDISISSGTSNVGDVYAIIVDSNPLPINSGLTNEGTMHGVTFNNQSFPESQWVTPPFYSVSVGTFTTGAIGGPNQFQSLMTPTGEGREIQHGLCIFLLKQSNMGFLSGAKVTVGYRKRVNRFGR